MPYEAIFINTHIAIKILTGSFCQLKSRSSLAKKGIEVKAGTIDAGYTGDIGILLYNNTGLTYQIRPNEKIAQAIFSPILNISAMKEVSHRKELEQTSRGQQGFGSTDKKEKEYEEEYEEKDLEDQVNPVLLYSRISISPVYPASIVPALTSMSFFAKNDLDFN